MGIRDLVVVALTTAAVAAAIAVAFAAPAHASPEKIVCTLLPGQHATHLGSPDTFEIDPVSRTASVVSLGGTPFDLVHPGFDQRLITFDDNSIVVLATGHNAPPMTFKFSMDRASGAMESVVNSEYVAKGTIPTADYQCERATNKF